MLLRFDAPRFGAADFDDEESPGGIRRAWARLSWYGFGSFLVLVVYFLYPQPLSELHLRMGDPRGLVFVAGLGLAMLGMALRRGLCVVALRRLPISRRAPYPVGILNALATAFIDEATWRGILLGLLLASNWPGLGRDRLPGRAVRAGDATRCAGPAAR